MFLIFLLLYAHANSPAYTPKLVAPSRCCQIQPAMEPTANDTPTVDICGMTRPADVRCKLCGVLMSFQIRTGGRYKDRWAAACQNMVGEGDKKTKCPGFLLPYGSRAPSKSASKSPTPSQQPAAPSADTPFVACSRANCKQKRLHAQCGRRSCRKHCLEEGGCSVHPPNAKTYAVAPVVGSQEPPAPPPAASSAGPLPRPAAPPVPDARQTHAPQMAEVFNDKVLKAQERAERAREKDSTLLVSSSRAAQSIHVVGWFNSNQAPAIKALQGGKDFVWPYLTISEKVLEDAGLTGNGKVQLYERSIGFWSDIDAGYVEKVGEGEVVLLKCASVDADACPGFANLLKGKAKPSHIRHDLAGNRAHVREVLSQGVSKMSNPAPSAPPATLDRARARQLLAQSASKPKPTSAKRRLSPSPPPVLQAPPRVFVKAEPSHVAVKVKKEATRSNTARTARPPQPSTASTRIKASPSVPLHEQILASFTDNDDYYISETEDDDEEEEAGTKDDPVVIASSDEEDVMFSDDPYDLTILEDPKKAWPRDFHACQIIACLIDMKRATKNKIRGQHKNIFRRHFPGYEYKKSTVCDQRTRFNKLSPQLRQNAVRAGLTAAGVWKVVMKDAPSMKEIRAEAARYRRVLEAIVIDDD
ncbi:hypothetical protein CC2G_009808 [Coprinopsis cinerea AmutBmut pab1-1]|nr:hypothetical protein CC2G_009808 [Coprinopsis cinerea AmutBmut pab1-1]